MVYVVGVIGFIGGFAIGQFMLFLMLKNRSNEELLTNKYLRLQYGIMNWTVAIGVMLFMVATYRYYFGNH